MHQIYIQLKLIYEKPQNLSRFGTLISQITQIGNLHQITKIQHFNLQITTPINSHHHEINQE